MIEDEISSEAPAKEAGPSPILPARYWGECMLAVQRDSALYELTTADTTGQALGVRERRRP
jgi:hypothetical protein